MATAGIETDTSREADESPRFEAASAGQPLVVKIALPLSAVALIVSGISLAGWAQASADRQQIETRLACLELPGPNDCGQDGR